MDFIKSIEFHSSILGVVVALVGVAFGVGFISPESVFSVDSECIFTDYASLTTLSIATVCVAIFCYFGTLYIISLLPHPSVEIPQPPIPRRVLIFSLVNSVLMLAALIISTVCIGKTVEIKTAKAVCLPLVVKVMIFVLPNLSFLLGGHLLCYAYIGFFRSFAGSSVGSSGSSSAGSSAGSSWSSSAGSSAGSSTTSFESARQSFDDAHVHEIDEGS